MRYLENHRGKRFNFQHIVTLWAKFVGLFLGKQLIPLLEISIEDPVGETLSADPDALQHTVTAQLVHHQRVLHGPGSCRTLNVVS